MGTIWFGTVATLGALAVIGVCCRRAQAGEGEGAWRAIALAVSSIYALGAALALLFAVALLAHGCDDACGGTGWRYDEGAWQWPAQLALAAVAAAVTLTTPLLVATRSYGLAVRFAGGATAVWLLWAWGFLA
ncbi:MAG: hypothetical protein U0R24_11705 [Solirubrobacterales bacterium]